MERPDPGQKYPIADSWIISRSKRFNNRIYYFNTVTGSSVWNLSDTELIKAQTNNNFFFGECPEPKEPPGDYFQKFSNSMLITPKTVYPGQDFFNTLRSNKPQHLDTSIAPSQLMKQQIKDETKITLSNRFNLLRQNHPVNMGLTLDTFGNNCSVNKQINLTVFSNDIGRHIVTQSINNPVLCEKQTGNVSENLPIATDERQPYFNISESIIKPIPVYKNAVPNTFAMPAPATPAPYKNYENKDEIWINNHFPNKCFHMSLMNALKNLFNCNESSKWLVAADSNVLIKNLLFLKKFISSDNNCHLLILSRVYKELEKITKVSEEYSEQAKTALCFIHSLLKTGNAIMDSNLVDDITNDIVIPNIEDHILYYCMHLVEKDFPLLLLSNEKKLLKKSQMYTVTTFTIKGLKKFLLTHQALINKLNSSNCDLESIVDDASIAGDINLERNPPQSVGQSSHKPVSLPHTQTSSSHHTTLNTSSENFSSLNSSTISNIEAINSTAENNLSTEQHAEANSETIDIENVNSEPIAKRMKTWESEDNYSVESYAPKKVQATKNTTETKFVDESTHSSWEIISNSQYSQVNNTIDNPMSQSNISEVMHDIDAFHITDTDSEYFLKEDIEEWVARYEQYMGEVLSKIIKKYESKLSGKPIPAKRSNIGDMLEYFTEIFTDKNVKSARDSLCKLLKNTINSKGIFTKEMDVSSTLSMVDCAIHFMNCIKAVPDYSEEADVALSSFTKLKDDIKMCHEIHVGSLNITRRSMDDISNFTVDDDADSQSIMDNTNPIRLPLDSEKLKTLKISVNNHIFFDEIANDCLRDNANDAKDAAEKNQDMNTFSVDFSEKIAEKDKQKDKPEPVISRKFTKFLEYEEILKSKELTTPDRDQLETHKECPHDSQPQDVMCCDDFTKYSLSDNESVTDCLEHFLMEIREVFLQVHDVCKNVETELESNETSSDRKNEISETIEDANTLIGDVQNKLSSILKREKRRHDSEQSEFNYDFSSNQILEYQHIIEKCCDQATLLQEALQYIKSIIIV